MIRGNESPTISVVIPTCNRLDLLKKCLEALSPLKQSIPSNLYEVIVTDDGNLESAENTVLQEFPWAKWVQGPMRGPAANRNNGVLHAHGTWIAFTDDDCIPSPDWLSASLNETEKGFDLLEGKTICAAGLSSPFYTSPVNEDGGYMWSCNILIRKTLFVDLGGFDENFPSPHMEDVDFRVRAQAKAGKARFIPSAVVDHPPRRIADRRKQLSDHSSTFYFCKKHNVSIKNYGFTYAGLLTNPLRRFRRNLKYGLSSAFIFFISHDVPLSVSLIWKFSKEMRSAK